MKAVNLLYRYTIKQLKTYNDANPGLIYTYLSCLYVGLWISQNELELEVKIDLDYLLIECLSIVVSWMCLFKACI